MKKFIKDLLGFIPRRISHLKWKRNFAGQLSAFKNLHQGEDCFIIGNGPSLNKMELNKLNDYYTFGLNKIYLLFEKTGLSVDYHACVNKFVIEQSAEEFKKMKSSSFISYKFKDARLLNKESVFHLGDAKSRNVFFKDLTEGISQGNTVTFVAMQIAYFMGFQRIFLVGVDHNFVNKGTAHKVETLKEDDMNHFDPSYFKGMKWQLPDLPGSEVFYLMAKEAFESDGREIIDATVDGKLTVFPKIDFEEALRMAKKK